MGKSLTPPSSKTISDAPAPDAGYNKTKMPDKESPNCTEAFADKAIFPLAEKDYMDGACGIS